MMLHISGEWRILVLSGHIETPTAWEAIAVDLEVEVPLLNALNESVRAILIRSQVTAETQLRLHCLDIMFARYRADPSGQATIGRIDVRLVKFTPV